MKRAQPEIVVDGVDFAEVVVGTSATMTVKVRNEGTGRLEVYDGTIAEGSSPDFGVDAWPVDPIPAGGEADLTLRYTPDTEGQDLGTLVLSTNQDGVPSYDVALDGLGVNPILDVDPELINFGVIDTGGSDTRSVRLTAEGTGDIRIASLELAGEDPAPYALTLPDDVVLPYTLPHGHSVSLDVTFTAPDAVGHDAELRVASNDYENPLVVVSLYANDGDDPGTDTAPQVEILDPNAGEYFMDDDTVWLSGHVYDADESCTNLVCGWYADGTKIADGVVAADGTVSGSSLLPIGEVTLGLRCFDSDGQMDEDTAAVVVWEHDEPVEYVISGGTTVYDWWFVDDDVTIQVDGADVLSDTNYTKDNHGPVTFMAKLGEVVEIIAVDQNYSNAELSGLTLHWGPSVSQPLNAPVCRSADPDEGCYDGTYDGPWPGIFFDERYTITIP